MRSNQKFVGLEELSNRAKTMVKMKKDKVYTLVYLRTTLTLVLPVATLTVKRIFSDMNIMKNRLRN